MLFRSTEEILFEIKDLDRNRWEYRLQEDSKNFFQEIKTKVDEIGIVGEELFSLTFNNQNAFNDFREISTITGSKTTKELCYALCLELESFISIKNWLGSEDNRNLERIEFHKKFEKYKKGELKSTVLKIYGNYRICKDCVGQILLFRGNPIFEEKEISFNDWRLTPFLKRSGENFAYLQSPLFLSPVTSSKENISEEKITYFTLLFNYYEKINDLRVKLKVFNASNQFYTLCEFDIQDASKYKLFQTHSDFFLGLFKETIYKHQNKYERKLILIDVSEPLNGEEILAHFLTLKLYYSYLLSRNLCVCSKDEFNELMKYQIYYTKKQYEKEIVNCQFFKKLYLNDFFREIDNEIYYIPYFLHDKPNNYIKVLLKYIQLKTKKNISIIEKMNLYNLSKIYQKDYENLDFIQKYIFYQKRTLINLLEKRESTWKLRKY